jgi:hypothetical protein
LQNGLFLKDHLQKVKGTVSRDFLDRFKFFQKFAEISKSQGAPPVSTTPAAKLPPVSTTMVANLPLVSTTPAANIATSFASVVDTGGKFAAGVNDTGDNLPPVSMTPLKVNLKAKMYL